MCRKISSINQKQTEGGGRMRPSEARKIFLEKPLFIVDDGADTEQDRDHCFSSPGHIMDPVEEIIDWKMIKFNRRQKQDKQNKKR